MLLTVGTAGTNAQTDDKAPLPAVWALVQEAERKIPINYANRYRNAALSKQSYLPFKVRAVWHSNGAHLVQMSALQQPVVLCCVLCWHVISHYM